MLIEKRQQLILDRLARDGAIGITSLSKSLGVSRETVRRDLNALSVRQLLRKTHGGAVANVTSEPTLTERLEANAEGKRRIGVAAAKMVPDGASLIIDCGSTTQALARALLQHRRLTVYTNDLRVATLLARRNGNVVHLLGGQLLDHEDATAGWETVAQIAQYHVDFAFIGVSGFADDGTLTDYERAGAELRSRMLAAAKVPVLLADRNKFGQAKPVIVGNFQKTRHVVTDVAPVAAVRKRFAAYKIDVMVVRSTGVRR